MASCLWWIVRWNWWHSPPPGLYHCVSARLIIHRRLAVSLLGIMEEGRLTYYLMQHRIFNMVFWGKKKAPACSKLSIIFANILWLTEIGGLPSQWSAASCWHCQMFANRRRLQCSSLVVVIRHEISPAGNDFGSAKTKLFQSRVKRASRRKRLDCTACICIVCPQVSTSPMTSITSP